MNIAEVVKYECSDKSTHDYAQDAINHQNDLAAKSIDKVMKAYAKTNPEVHYPALSITLVPFMVAESKNLIKALELATCQNV